VDGTLYGLPGEGGGYRIAALYINRDLFRQAGLPIPGPRIEDALTMDETLEIARRLTIDRTGDGVPEQYGLNYTKSVTHWKGWLPPNGARHFNDDKTEVWFDRPEVVEVLQFMQDVEATHKV